MTVAGMWINKFFKEVHFCMDNLDSLDYYDCFVELRETYFVIWCGELLVAMINASHVIAIEFAQEAAKESEQHEENTDII